MQMHHTVGLSRKPTPDLGTPVRQPEVILMKKANSVALGLFDAEIGLCRPGQQIGTALRSDGQLVGKAVNDCQARVVRACVYDNYLNSPVLLIHDRLERGSEPSLPVMGRNDYRQPGFLRRPSVAHRWVIVSSGGRRLVRSSSNANTSVPRPPACRVDVRTNAGNRTPDSAQIDELRMAC